MAPIYPASVRNADGSIMVDNNGIGMMVNAANTHDQPTRVEVGTLKAENRRLLVATVDE